MGQKLLQQDKTGIVVATIVTDAELSVGLVAGKGFASLGQHAVGGVSTKPGPPSVEVQETDSSDTIMNDLADGPFKLVAIVHVDHGKAIEQRLTLQAQDGKIVNIWFSVGENNEFLPGDDVIVDMHPEPIGGG